MSVRFIYVSQIPRTGTGGQNKFEKGFIDSLLRREEENQELKIKIFSASTEGEISKNKRLVLIPLNKNSYIGFVLHQIRLLCSLWSYLWRERKSRLCMFVRYHDAMLAPLILSYIFNIRLTIRTGPVLPNLAIKGKKPGTIIYCFVKWVLGNFYRKASAIVTVTEKIKNWVEETYKIDPNKVKVIPNAADTMLFFPEPANREKWNLPKNEFIFGYVGAIYEAQGLGTIIQALGLLKNKQDKVPFLFIVGDGEDVASLKLLSKELNVADRIIWTGNIPHEQVRSTINACDMMLAPFQKHDLELKGSSALKLWEYLACDKPVLASEYKDHQFLEKMLLGKMVEPGNIELWANAMATEAEKNDCHLQGRGKTYVCDEHSYDSIVERFLTISLRQDQY